MSNALARPVHGDPAVLARSAVAATESVLVTGRGPGGTVLEGAPLALSSGRLGLRVPRGAPLAGARRTAATGGAAAIAVHVTVVVPIAVRDRVRARVTVSGALLPWDRVDLDEQDERVLAPVLAEGDEVWVLAVTTVLVASGEDLVAVAADSWAAAAPDPLAQVEAAHLVHLQARHPDVVTRLAALLEPGMTVGARRVVPVGLDSRGIVLRAERPDGDVDARLHFSGAAGTPAALRHEFATLLAGGHAVHAEPTEERRPSEIPR